MTARTIPIRGARGQLAGSRRIYFPVAPSDWNRDELETPVAQSDAVAEANPPEVMRIDEAWGAYRTLVRTAGREHEDGSQLAYAARERLLAAMSRATSGQERRLARESYAQEIESIPLGIPDEPLSQAWGEFHALFPGEATHPTASGEKHEWIIKVAEHSDNPAALAEIWRACDTILDSAQVDDPRLDTALSARATLLEDNPNTPAEILEDAYSDARLNGFGDDPYGHYASHLVLAPTHYPSMSKEMALRIATRLAVHAAESSSASDDIDDASPSVTLSTGHTVKCTPVFSDVRVDSLAILNAGSLSRSSAIRTAVALNPHTPSHLLSSMQRRESLLGKSTDVYAAIESRSALLASA